MPVAGKTGTAQVDGAASHSWFVGFAPYDGAAVDGKAADGKAVDDGAAGGGAGKKIAFAVVLENAGYGARATPVVAEVVRAAKELGIAR
jgi:cell division protein FtsI/penicillin-binding protein 2